MSVMVLVTAFAAGAHAQGETGYDDADVAGILETPEGATIWELDFGAGSFGDKIAPGDFVSFEEDGFRQLSTATLDIESQRRTLAFLQADEEGVVRGTVKIPEDMSEGEHTLVLSGTDPDGNPIERRLIIEIGFPSSGGGVDAPVVASVGGVVAALAVLVVLGRYLTRRREERMAELTGADRSDF